LQPPFVHRKEWAFADLFKIQIEHESNKTSLDVPVHVEALGKGDSLFVQNAGAGR